MTKAATQSNKTESGVPVRVGKVVFADASAAALLRESLPALHDPAAAGWEMVKHNDSRTTWRGTVAGQVMYVKHFHSRSWMHKFARRVGFSDARKEMHFSAYLGSVVVPTAQVLAAYCDGRKEWLCSLGVADAMQGDAWHVRELSRGPAGERAIRALTAELGRMIGTMHASGVIHCDLHCGNVLVPHAQAAERVPELQGASLVVMDLHRMRRRHRLSRWAMAANLAQLFHDRRDFTTRSGRMRFLKHYLAALGGGRGSVRGWALLIEKFARPHSRRQYANRDRRVWGNNRYFTRLKLADGWQGHAALACKHRLAGSVAAGLEFTPQQWQQALADVEAVLDPKAGEVIKESPSGTMVRRKLTVGTHVLDVYIKRPRRKKAWKIVLDCLRRSRSKRGFCLGHELLTRRVATALPLAVIERRVGLALVDSALITEAVDGVKLLPFLNTWLATPPRGDTPLTVPQQRQLARAVLAQLGRMLQRLHDNRFAHRDLKSNNILVRWQVGHNPEVVLVDLDGLKRVPFVTQRRRYQGLMRLNVSLLECPVVNHAGRLRMLLGYLRRPGSGRIPFKPLWRTLETWSGRKLQEQIRSRRIRQRASRRPGI